MKNDIILNTINAKHKEIAKVPIPDSNNYSESLWRQYVNEWYDAALDIRDDFEAQGLIKSVKYVDKYIDTYTYCGFPTFKLFIDDLRDPVDDDCVIARSSRQAINRVKMFGIPDEIMFDHDLGGDDTSMKFLHWLGKHMMDNDLKFPKGFKYTVHSANPVGSKNIHAEMCGLLKYIGVEE